MKKVIYSQYGDVNVLEMIDSEIPDVDKNTLLVKVKAVSINPLDWKIFEGEMKLMAGSKFPKGVGIDFSGIIEETGSSISQYKKGDAVFGVMDVFKGGALAEYIVVAEKDIALKPDQISFEQAAAMPIVGSAALQIFDQLVPLSKGLEVLINGAAGGIGMFATQTAKMKGARVTTVVGTKGISLVRKWGSDNVINYQEEDILKSEKQYDVVIDLSAKITFAMAKKIVKPASIYVNAVPGPKQIIGSFINNLFSKKKYKVLLLKPTSSYLETLAQYAAGGMDIVIDRTYPMTSFKEAYTQVPKGGILGKAVFTTTS